MDQDEDKEFSIDDVIAELFYSTRQYKAILQRLKLIHGIDRSMSWLKRQLKRLGLKRRSPDPPDETVKTLIESIISCSNQLRGYRAVWRILYSKYRLPVRRDTVMRIMRQIDPEGVKLRKKRRLKRRLYNSKGPNYIWHLDGYDKLSPYGLTIHGCIDGYSRKLIWLKLSPTNHDPKVISRHYLESIETIKGCPRVVRADHGTENCLVAKCHIAFRMDHEDCLSGARSFIYGPSTANIRIEAWWSQLRRFKTNWWIDLCKGLQSEGLYDHSNTIHRYTLAFSFANLLQKDLDSFAADWNSHPIRKNRRIKSPHGCPDDLFDMPALQGVEDQLQPFDTDLWVTCMLNESSSSPTFYPDDFKTSATTILQSALGLTHGGITHDNCRNVYLTLVELIDELVNRGITICSMFSATTSAM
ncbi:uncharacterized protein [Dysidea avara]|uniref:uncharacterized protein isoform X2 n=1 Tax=Dysidea avara TaxID=196820 RepID=UPI0033172C45